MATPFLASLPTNRTTSGETPDLQKLYGQLAQTALGTANAYGANALKLYPKLASAERTATTAQRQSDLNALNRFGSGYMDALNKINPNWQGSLDALRAESQRISGGQPSNPFLDQLTSYATDAFSRAQNAGPSALRQQLDQQAMSDLALGRSLSPEQQRTAEQAARAAWSARGLGYSPGAIGAEILNRDAFATQRQNERRKFAMDQQAAGLNEDNSLWSRIMGAGQLGVGVGGLTQQQQQQDRSFLLGAAGAQQAALNPVLSLFNQRAAVQPTAGGQLMQGGTSLVSSAAPVLNYGSDLFNTNFNANAGTSFANTKAMNDAGGQAQFSAPYFDAFGGYHSQQQIGGFCWVAREVFGNETVDSRVGEIPAWEAFRAYMLTEADDPFVRSYGRNGEALAAYLREHPDARDALKPLFADIVDEFLNGKED